MNGRLLFRVDPVAGESPRGYLCRTAHEHGYNGPNAIAEIAGLWVSGRVAGLDQNAAISPIAHALRLEPAEWRSMCYRAVKGRNRFKQRSFYGEAISAYDLNYRWPRLCPGCLRERPIWWAVWDLGLVAACPRHGCVLLNQCPACQRKTGWERPAVYKCRCGFDFREVSPEPADPDMLAVTAIVYRAAGSTLAEATGTNINVFRFPPALLQLNLGALLRFIVFIGSVNDGSILRRRQRPFRATDLAGAITICRGAASLLRDWPRPLRDTLRQMVPQSATPAALNFSNVFANFYRHLFRVLPRQEFGFLHDAFEKFVIEDWKGFIRGQHRYFSAAVRRNSHWVTANEAERIARVTGARIVELARNGQLDAVFLKVRRGGSRTECWIKRESLNQWVAVRDSELAPYMSRPEAMAALGLTHRTIVSVAASGAIRYVKGPERNFPARCFFFLREDVINIKAAFEHHRVPALAYSKPGKFIALRHAMKNYLGHSSALAAVICAVLDGRLVPVGCAKRFRGITGYIFAAHDLRRYRPMAGVDATTDDLINYREAATLLGVELREIRGLVAGGILHDAVEYQFGLSKLLTAADVQRFAENYVAISALAKRRRLNTIAFFRYLREGGTPLLSVPLPEKGTRHASFLRRDVASHIQIPSPKALKEAADVRIVAERKKRWAQFRLAKEAALDKPMRRVRRIGAHCAE